MLLIVAIQVSTSGDIEDGSVSLEVSNTIQDGGAGGNPAFQSSIDDVGDQPKTSCPVGGQILFGGTVPSDHDVVAGRLGPLLRHPKPERRFP